MLSPYNPPSIDDRILAPAEAERREAGREETRREAGRQRTEGGRPRAAPF